MFGPRVRRERVVTQFDGHLSEPFELAANSAPGTGWDGGHGRLRHERAIAALAEPPHAAFDPKSVSMRISWLSFGNTFGSRHRSRLDIDSTSSQSRIAAYWTLASRLSS
jgi:hypothetical protein